MFENVLPNMLQNMLPNMLQNMPKLLLIMPKIMPKNMPKNMPKLMPSMPKPMPKLMPENMTSNMAKTMLKIMPKTFLAKFLKARFPETSSKVSGVLGRSLSKGKSERKPRSIKEKGVSLRQFRAPRSSNPSFFPFKMLRGPGGPDPRSLQSPGGAPVVHFSRASSSMSPPPPRGWRLDFPFLFPETAHQALWAPKSLMLFLFPLYNRDPVLARYVFHPRSAPVQGERTLNPTSATRTSSNLKNTSPK